MFNGITSGSASAKQNYTLYLFFSHFNQFGEDSGLQFAMADADLISDLHPFRGSCKPVWLFMVAGGVIFEH